MIKKVNGGWPTIRTLFGKLHIDERSVTPQHATMIASDLPIIRKTVE